MVFVKTDKEMLEPTEMTSSLSDDSLMLLGVPWKSLRAERYRVRRNLHLKWA